MMLNRKRSKILGSILALSILAAPFCGCAGSSMNTVRGEAADPPAAAAEPAMDAPDASIPEDAVSDVPEPAPTDPIPSMEDYYAANRIALSETMPLYFKTPDQKEELTLYFEDEVRDIPFISLTDFAALKCGMMERFIGDTGAHIEVTADGDVVTLTRENGSSTVFDFGSRTMILHDYDSFMALSFTKSRLDIVYSSGVDDQGRPIYFERLGSSMFQNAADVEISLDQYAIPIYFQDGEGYVPLQIFSDFFADLYFLLYNGEAVFCTDEKLQQDGQMSPLGELYYAVGPGERTESLAQFTYNELAMVIDHLYGKRNIRSMRDADTLIDIQMDLYHRMVSPDIREATEAVIDLMEGYLCDGHTYYLDNSHYLGPDFLERREGWTPVENPSSQDVFNSLDKCTAARAERYPDGVPHYEEVDDTAFVTFDKFTPWTQDYYAEPATLETDETVGVIMYAHSQITREGSPIKNVVVDLTCNMGGYEDAAAFVCAWMMGEGRLNLADTLTLAQASTVYHADTNCDHVFDERDTLGDRNVYCLISGGSFSCANLVPAMLKSSGKATLLGTTSAGGSNVVKTMCLADGTQIQLSGNIQISTLRNGVFYDADAGIEPDFTISKPEHYYDRQWLTDYIHQLP